MAKSKGEGGSGRGSSIGEEGISGVDRAKRRYRRESTAKAIDVEIIQPKTAVEIQTLLLEKLEGLGVSVNDVSSRWTEFQDLYTQLTEVIAAGGDEKKVQRLHDKLADSADKLEESAKEFKKTGRIITQPSPSAVREQELDISGSAATQYSDTPLTVESVPNPLLDDEGNLKDQDESILLDRKVAATVRNQDTATTTEFNNAPKVEKPTTISAPIDTEDAANEERADEETENYVTAARSELFARYGGNAPADLKNRYNAIQDKVFDGLDDKNIDLQREGIAELDALMAEERAATTNASPKSNEEDPTKPADWYSTRESYKFAAMHGGISNVPKKIYEEYKKLRKALKETEVGSNEEQLAEEKLKLFAERQFATSDASKSGMSYAEWSNRLNLIKWQQHLRNEELAKYGETGLIMDESSRNELYKLQNELEDTLNTGDEVKMAEISAAADAIVAEQRRKAEFEKEEQNRPRSLNEEHEDSMENDPSIQPETPKEWREKLRGLIEGGKEKIAWWKSAEEGLIRRSAELDARAEHIGGLENHFRKWGEQYNKYDWKLKLAIGGTLGLGVTAFSMVGVFPLAYVFMAGIGLQRTAALSTMFLKFEKNSLGQKHGKEKAMGKAMLYTAAMGGAMLAAGSAVRGGLDLFNKTSIGQHTTDWLKEHWPFAAGTKSGKMSTIPEGSWAEPALKNPPTIPSQVDSAPTAPAAEAGHVTAVESQEPEPTAVVETETATEAEPQAPEPDSPDKAGEDVKNEVKAEDTKVETPTEPEVVQEMPTIPATKGKGYEYMLKELWKELHKPGNAFTPPTNLDPKSDLGRLLEVQLGDEAGINQLVHKIAKESQHGFFDQGTQRSVQIDEDSELSIKSSTGQITLDGQVHAAADAPTTAPYYPEGAKVSETVSRPSADVLSSAATPEGLQGANVGPENGEKLLDDEWERISDQAMRPSSESMEYVAPAVSDMPETQAPAPQVEHSFKVNHFGTAVQLGEPHFYAGPEGEVFIYGGSPAEQEIQIREYLKANPKGEIIGTNNTNRFRMSWKIVDGNVGEQQMQKEGWFGIKRPMTPPGVEDLKIFIK